MNEFKFVCPSCGQKVKVDVAASGRQFACPGCRAELLVPAAPQQPGQVPTATRVQGKQPASKAVLPGKSAPASLKLKRPGGDTSQAAPPTTVPSPVLPTPAARVVAAAPKPSKPRIRLPGSSDPAQETPTPAAQASKSGTPQPLKVGPAAVHPTPLPQAGGLSKSPVQAASNATPPPPVPETPAETAASPQDPVQIAALTPTIKREIVRSVRNRIADETHWMPRITAEREYAYASKDVEGKSVPVEVTSPEATRFSVLGASLLELNLAHVTRTATGRAEFLDEELLDAIRQVAGEETGAQEVGASEPFSKGKQVPAISHAQSLEALNVLEKRYSREIEGSTGNAGGGLDDLRLEDLTRKLERGIPVTDRDICAALSNELAKVNARLAALERTPGRQS